MCVRSLGGEGRCIRWVHSRQIRFVRMRAYQPGAVICLGKMVSARQSSHSAQGCGHDSLVKPACFLYGDSSCRVPSLLMLVFVLSLVGGNCGTRTLPVMMQGKNAPLFPRQPHVSPPTLNENRLQSTSIAQHNDIVRMEASLARLRDARHPADASPNTTASNSPAAESTQHFSGTSCTATDTSRAIRHPQKDHQQQHHQQQHRSLSGRPSFDTESSSNRFVGGDGHQPSFSFDGMDSDNQHASSSGQKATATAVEMPKENTWRGHGLAWSESSSDISPSAVGAAAKQRRKMSVDVMSTGVEDDYGGRGDGVRSSGSLGGGRRDVRTEWQVFGYCVRTYACLCLFLSSFSVVFLCSKSRLTTCQTIAGNVLNDSPKYRCTIRNVSLVVTRSADRVCVSADENESRNSKA